MIVSLSSSIIPEPFRYRCQQPGFLGHVGLFYVVGRHFLLVLAKIALSLASSASSGISFLPVTSAMVSL